MLLHFPLSIILVILIFLSNEIKSLKIKYSNVDSLDSFLYIGKFAVAVTPGIKANEIRLSSLSLQSSSQNNKNNSDEDLLNSFPYGMLSYDISGIPTNSKLNLLVYTDYIEWTKVYNDMQISCHEKAKMASFSMSLTQSTLFYYGNVYYNKFTLTNKYGSNKKGNAKGSAIFPSDTLTPAKWAFVAISNCDLDFDCSLNSNSFGIQQQQPSVCQGSLILDKIGIHFTNGVWRSQKEFSYDERGMLGMAVTMFLIQILIVIFAIFTRTSLARLKKLHLSVRMVVLSTFLQWFALLFFLAYCAAYGSSGYRSYGTLFMGNLLMALANLFLIIMLIFVAKGWTIVRKRLSPLSVCKIIVYSTFLLICIVFSQVYLLSYYDFSTVSFLYASKPGILILCLRCIFAAIWFSYSCYTTLKKFQSKRRFYHKFFAIFLVWLVAPGILVLFTLAVPNYGRTFFVFVWETILVSLAQFLLLVLYNPAISINSSFPFHAMTDMETNYLPTVNEADDSGARKKNNKKEEEGTIGGEEGSGNGGSGGVAGDGKGVLPMEPMRKMDKGIVNVGELFSEIKGYSVVMASTMTEISSNVQFFIRVLESWDVEDDEEDQEME